MSKSYTEDELRVILKKRVAASSQTAVAKELGISLPFLNDVVHGRRNLTETIAQALGFKKVVIYRKVA